MSAPRNAGKRGSKRFYSWRGDNYWSVTTIIDGGIPKRALIHWAANEVSRYVCDNITTLGPLVREDPEGAYDLLKRSPWRKKEKAADAGTAIHEAIEAYILGKPMPPWSEDVAPRLRQFERFLTAYAPEYHLTEASVYNKTQRYAGTLDALASIDGRKLVVDVKSGKGVYPEVALQLSAYRHAEIIGMPDGSEAPMPSTEGAVCLHLTDEDYTLYEVRADEDVFKAFLHVREVFRFVEQTGKDVIGEPVAFPAVAA